MKDFQDGMYDFNAEDIAGLIVREKLTREEYMALPKGEFKRMVEEVMKTL